MATIRKRGGKYHAQIRRVGFPSTTKTFYNLKDAREWTRHVETLQDRRELGPDRRLLESITLGELVVRYRDEVSSKKRGSDIETFVLNAFLRHPICSKVLGNVTSRDFALYRDARLKEIKPASLKRQLAPIQNMFEIARYEWGIPLAENPLDKVKLTVADNRRERRLRDGELERILEAAGSRRNPYISPIILIALETAMRRGEILRLRWGDIDFKLRSVTILEAKNGRSRKIPISDKALNTLVDTIDIQKGISNRIRSNLDNHNNSNVLHNYLSKSNNKNESEVHSYLISLVHDPNLCSFGSTTQTPNFGLNPDGPVFPITPNALRLVWQRMLKMICIQDLHFHDLRHEAISRFFELGLTVPEVASISGHRDMRMLFRYAHASDKLIYSKLNKA